MTPAPPIEAPIRSAMEAVLGEVEATGARILFAVESGSRAWGFPSPDSDYDARFVYVRSVADHIRLQPMRDVIEHPPEGLLDVNGWDLRKALLLALKGNAVIHEWLASPLLYSERTGARALIGAHLAEIFEPHGAISHYRGLAKAHLAKTDGLEGEVNLKKLFYLFRPIAALEWLEAHEGEGPPPMALGDLLASVSIPQAVLDDLRSLLALKATTREMGHGAVPADLRRFILERYAHHEESERRLAFDLAARRRRRALTERFYRDMVLRYGEDRRAAGTKPRLVSLGRHGAP